MKLLKHLIYFLPWGPAEALEAIVLKHYHIANIAPMSDFLCFSREKVDYRIFVFVVWNFGFDELDKSICIVIYFGYLWIYSNQKSSISGTIAFWAQFLKRIFFLIMMMMAININDVSIPLTTSFCSCIIVVIFFVDRLSL